MKNIKIMWGMLMVKLLPMCSTVIKAGLLIGQHRIAMLVSKSNPHNNIK